MNEPIKAAHTHNGFTLIELMITVAIIGILAAIALPSYRDYVIRGQLVDATTALSAMRAKMEQYYQDNRTYAAITGTTPFTPPCSSAYNAGKFTVSCPTAPTASVYTVQAVGITGSSVAGFTYTIDQTNAQKTTAMPTGWPTAPQSCWIIKKGTTC